MPADEPTVSATEFARVTGLSRERLRTWERRHGFPRPVRLGSGARRYRVADVAPAIAARRAIDDGRPVAEALASATGAARGSGAELDAATLARATEDAPLPVMLIAGPDPMRAAYVNAAGRRVPGAPAIGDPVPGELARRLAPLFAAEGAHPFERAAWRPGGASAACVAAPVPGPAGAPPLLALYDLETGGSQATRDELARAEAERDRALGALAAGEGALELCELAAAALRERSGVAAIVETTEVLMRRLGAGDGALAPYMSGQLVIGRSVRGSLGPEMLTVAGRPELARALREGAPAVLSAPEARIAGIDESASLACVPAVCAGEPLGMLLLVFPERPSLPAGTLRALLLIATALGLALMQERLLADEPGAGR